jgi:hypothetical protein
MSQATPDPAPDDRAPPHGAADPLDQLNQPFVSEESLIVAGDDLSIVPAMASPRSSAAAKTAAGAHRRASSLQWRRTLVPILLTTGALYVVLGALWFTTADDSPFRAPGVILPAALIPFGFTLVGLGLMSAMEIQRILHKR